MMNKHSMTFCTLLACLLVTTATVTTMTGCKVDENVTNYAGNYHAFIAGTPDEIAEAAVEVLEGMKLRVVSSEASMVDAQVVARTAQDDRITITVDRESDTVSDVWVRVGAMGDQYLSERILNEIKQQVAR